GAFESVTDAELAALRRLTSGSGELQLTAGRRQPAAPAPVVIQQPTTGAVAAAATAPGGAGDAVGAADVVVADDSGGRKTGASAADLPAIPPISADPTQTVRPTTANRLAGNIQVVFLPDLDEQYAIHNSNILSKSAY